MTSYKKEDFTNSNEVKWCPGCGDYAILKAIQSVLPKLGLAPEKHVFISGIGCAGRLPYYMNTYGFHTIHGRALAVATGLSALRDDLTIWVITGDGDALSIGGNHFIHALRRNVNINVLLFNNQVYGLTKGQFSPTSEKGQITKTSPQGVTQEPLNPIELALAAGASFVARAIDKDPDTLADLLVSADAHQGLSFVEIYQDCHIFNKGAFDAFSAKNNRQENTIMLKNNEPLLFGLDSRKGLVMQDEAFKVVAAKNAALTTHQTSNLNRAMLLARLRFPQFPIPLGIYYQVNRTSFALEHELKKSASDLTALYRAKASWHVE
ncbi:MAG: 2-oxoacid:ferredoxin oxidoreductase subunit beta [Legionellales bacterium RIFCSPHIGHO2_12_FULL_37_14]|nr:MAG: 2-oxoacid:ferredoxin oxidoreductase subunit beta [Legionellales bacterium RIFCSPHIGHO2_12_FULL_37_14]